MFNKETEYAFRALVYVQTQNYLGHRPGIEETAREIDAPHFYTGKIMQRLVRMGFLLSAKGRGGGFFFDPDKGELPLRDIVVAVEGEKMLCGCVFGLKRCDHLNPCPLHHQYAGIRGAVNQMISTETVQSLARKNLADLKEKPDDAPKCL